jgi:hypothetical protein
MIVFTKSTLIESVLREIGITDVTGDQWQQDTSREMDAEFYSEQAGEFWNDMRNWIQTLKSADEQELKQWAYEAGWDSDVVRNIKSFIDYTLDFDWVRDKITDKQVYSLMKQGNANVDSVLKKLFSQYLF